MNGYEQPYGYPGAAPTMNYGYLRDTEKRALKQQSKRAGLCVIAFVLLQKVIPFVLAMTPGFYNLYDGNDLFAEVVEMFFYLLTMLLPFLVAFASMEKNDRRTVDQFNPPVSKGAAVLAVLSGYFFCTIGNLATNYLLAFLENAGVTTAGGDYAAPESAPSFFMMLITIGMLPALAEEFSLRGVVLQPMRRFGDKFAILMTAFVFALMHGNLAQIPFAFIAGTALGYFTVATGSIWVGVCIHFLNNMTSVVLSYLLEVRPTAAETFFNIENSVMIVVGIICTAVFLTLCKKNKLQKSKNVLSTGEKFSAYIFTLPMIVAIILLMAETAKLIQYKG